MKKTTLVKTNPLTSAIIQAKSQWLSDHSAEISTYCDDRYLAFIEAPTGAGKTSYITGHVVSEKNKVILLVPTVAQVIQLKSTLKNLRFKSCFSSGGEGIDIDAALIVATYDKLATLLSGDADAKIKKRNVGY